MQQPGKWQIFSVLVGGLALTASVFVIGCGGGGGSSSNDATTATTSDLANMQFEFSDGAAFGLANEPVTMSYGNFTGNTGTFTLTAPSVIASGTVVLGSCDHTVEETDNPNVLPAGTQINCDVCDIEGDGSMLVTCGEGENQMSSASTGAGTNTGSDGTGSTGSTGSDGGLGSDTTGSTGN
jgi:hypothetical protein